MKARTLLRWIVDFYLMDNNDDESSHIIEDGLHSIVLKAIANGAENPQLLAQIVLLTEEIDFGRYHA